MNYNNSDNLHWFSKETQKLTYFMVSLQKKKKCSIEIFFFSPNTQFILSKNKFDCKNINLTRNKS